jgi:hypothetical protein
MQYFEPVLCEVRDKVFRLGDGSEDLAYRLDPWFELLSDLKGLKYFYIFVNRAFILHSITEVLRKRADEIRDRRTKKAKHEYEMALLDIESERRDELKLLDSSLHTYIMRCARPPLPEAGAQPDSDEPLRGPSPPPGTPKTGSDTEPVEEPRSRYRFHSKSRSRSRSRSPRAQRQSVSRSRSRSRSPPAKP